MLVALAVIFLPMILDGSGTPERLKMGVDIPEPVEAPESSFDEPDVESELARDDDADGAAAEADSAAAGSTESAREPAVTGWVVQVGSFARDANAVVLRDRLRDKGFAAFVSEGAADGDPVWRVQVGPFATEDEARDVARDLEAERGQAALIMSYP